VTTAPADPLTVHCADCGAQAGEPCERAVSWAPALRPAARKPHAARIEAAEAYRAAVIARMDGLEAGQ
jgi:hypothetical protein